MNDTAIALTSVTLSLISIGIAAWNVRTSRATARVLRQATAADLRAARTTYQEGQQ